MQEDRNGGRSSLHPQRLGAHAAAVQRARALAQLAGTAEWDQASGNTGRRSSGAPQPAVSTAALHVSWDEALAPDALDLVVLFRGQSLRRKPHASAKLKGDELAAAQAAWDAADDTPRRRQIRKMRKQTDKQRARPPTAEDSARRVEQRRNDAGQQQAHRGARPPMIRVLCPLPISF